MMKQWRHITVIYFCFSLLAVNVAAQDKEASKLYRYKDAHGQIMLSNQMPPDQVMRGYEILDKNGQVEEVVEPALTQEQRDAKAAEEKRKENDKILMGLYSTYEEIDQARDVRTGQIKGSIIIIEGNVKTLIERRETLQAEAAELERVGKKVSSDTTKQLFVLDSRIKAEKKKLANEQELLKSELARFAADRARLGELRHLTESTNNGSDVQLLPMSEPNSP